VGLPTKRNTSTNHRYRQPLTLEADGVWDRRSGKLVDFEFDREEIVQWPGVGGLTLRSAVQRVMAAPPENRMLVTL
jgi:hypothetical protein